MSHRHLIRLWSEEFLRPGGCLELFVTLPSGSLQQSFCGWSVSSGIHMTARTKCFPAEKGIVTTLMFFTSPAGALMFWLIGGCITPNIPNSPHIHHASTLIIMSSSQTRTFSDSDLLWSNISHLQSSTTKTGTVWQAQRYASKMLKKSSIWNSFKIDLDDPQISQVPDMSKEAGMSQWAWQTTSKQHVSAQLSCKGLFLPAVMITLLRHAC